MAELLLTPARSDDGPRLRALLFHWPRWRYVFLMLLLGLIFAILFAWSCALWVPASWDYAPGDHRDTAPVKSDPDGQTGLFFEQGGVGWNYMTYVGERYRDGSIFWRNPYGEYTTHRSVGWPFRALRSRVTELDNERWDANNPVAPPPVRTRWELPWSEIFSRGPGSKEFPAWMRVQEDRRVPLIPMPLGLAADAVLYALVAHVLCSLGIYLWRRFRTRRPRGFEVVRAQS